MRAKFKAWVRRHQFELIVFNIILIILVLLRSAGYFLPFFPITINMIYVAALFLAIFLLSARSPAFFFLAILFWLIAAFFKIAGIDIWAERAGLYTYESLVVGVLLLIFESARAKK